MSTSRLINTRMYVQPRLINKRRYVHDNIARYGFGTLNGNDEWNGEPPLGTRGTGGFGGGYSDLDCE